VVAYFCIINLGANFSTMANALFEDQKFENLKLLQDIQCFEFSGCLFRSCDFTGLNLSGSEFVDCQFEFCNLSMVQVQETIFTNAVFRGCKLMGMDFSKVRKFLLSMSFEECNLSYAFFFGLNLKGAKFINCLLEETNFSEATLVEANFSGSNLVGAIFDRTNLERADFTSASGYSINPAINRIRKAKFSLPEVVGLLHSYDIEVF